MRANFISNMDKLNISVVEMFEVVRKQCILSMKALKDGDIELSYDVIKLDDKTDMLMGEIEEKVIELMALQNPMSKDLRTLFAISKIVTDLERVGDFSVNICKKVIEMKGEKLFKPLIDIPKMNDQIIIMLDLTKEAFINKSKKKAFKAGEMDEIVDDLYELVYSEILLKINENVKNIDQGTKLLFIGRYLERMADHITNICERIIYIISGDILEIN